MLAEFNSYQQQPQPSVAYVQPIAGLYQQQSPQSYGSQYNAGYVQTTGGSYEQPIATTYQQPGASNQQYQPS